MSRERSPQMLLVLVGLLFLAGIYPITTSLWHPGPSDDPGDTMMLSLYVTLGIFLLLAVRNPSGNRSLIAFTAGRVLLTARLWRSWHSSARTNAEDFWAPSPLLSLSAWPFSLWLPQSGYASWQAQPLVRLAL